MIMSPFISVCFVHRHGNTECDRGCVQRSHLGGHSQWWWSGLVSVAVSCDCHVITV